MDPNPSARELLAKLVGFNTESQNSNLELIGFVEAYLGAHGVRSIRVPDESGQKAGLFAQIGPDLPGGVVLSGHTDVVPVEGQDWSTDPYVLSERGGKLYGRGTCDMKGFLAICLAAVPAMRAAVLQRPIQLALSYDEEIGCLGAPPLIEEMRRRLPPASAVIVGEPTMMRVVTGHKAIAHFDTHVRGFEVHSSLMHQGVSAIMTAARLIDWLAQKSRENEASAGTSPYVPPWTTLHVGRISGGTAHNITARDCVFTTDIRCLPEEDIADWLNIYRAYAAEVEAEIRKIRPEAGIEIRMHAEVPGCRAEDKGTAEALARSITGDNGTNVVSYATEAGQFQDGGYSAVICGPGSIKQAHQANEYITLDQLEAGERFVTRLIDRLNT